MQVIDAGVQTLEEWRPGVMTRMVVSAAVGARQLCVFEQFVAPGAGAPTHMHAVEEVLRVLDGVAEVWQDTDRATLQAGQCVIVAAGVRHGFSNVGDGTLHVQATLAASWFEAAFDNEDDTRRRWQGA